MYSNRAHSTQDLLLKKQRTRDMSTAHTTTTHRQRHAAIARGAQFLHWQTYFRLHFRYACCSSHSGPHAWYSFLQVVSHSSSAFRSASSFFVRAFGTRLCVARRSLIVRFEALAPGSIAASIGGHWRSTRCIGYTPCKGGRPWSSPPPFPLLPDSLPVPAAASAAAPPAPRRPRFSFSIGDLFSLQ